MTDRNEELQALFGGAETDENPAPDAEQTMQDFARKLFTPNEQD